MVFCRLWLDDDQTKRTYHHHICGDDSDVLTWGVTAPQTMVEADAAPSLWHSSLEHHRSQKNTGCRTRSNIPNPQFSHWKIRNYSISAQNSIPSTNNHAPLRGHFCRNHWKVSMHLSSNLATQRLGFWWLKKFDWFHLQCLHSTEWGRYQHSNVTICILTTVESDQTPSIYIRLMLDPIWSGMYLYQSWWYGLYSCVTHIWALVQAITV